MWYTFLYPRDVGDAKGLADVARWLNQVKYRLEVNLVDVSREPRAEALALVAVPAYVYKANLCF